MLAVAVLFLILTWLTFSLRVYVRGFMLRTWGKDDTAMLVTVVSLAPISASRMCADLCSSSLPSTSRSRW